jgi:uncharacterized beta barrel domain-containing protein DUF5777
VTRRSSAAITLLVVLFLLVAALPRARAQSTAGAQDPTTVQNTQPPAQTSDDPAVLDPIEPDFSVVNLPTTLRLPRHGGNFHLTHRFNENLRQDGFDTAAQNLFGLDTGANIGLEFRWGVMRNLEAIVQRTSISRDTQFSAKYDAIHQNEARPVSLSGIVSIEGDNNFREHYSPAIGLVVSRKIASAVALYATPFWVHNTTAEGTAVENTGFIGLGARIRFLPTAYLIGEVSPRLGGFVIRDPEFAFGIEKRVGAHVFALTFTNNPGTTFRQLALGGNPSTLNLGFNLTRKFF